MLEKWFFLLFWIASSSFFVWFSSKIKTVYLEDPNLIVVARGGAETVIPLLNVEDVSQKRSSVFRLIIVKLRPGSPMEEFVFIAREKMFRLPFYFSDHPIVEELREAVKRAQTANTASA
jgi:hypothetical protein